MKRYGLAAWTGPIGVLFLALVAAAPASAQPDTWQSRASLGMDASVIPEARHDAVAFAIGGKGYFGTGYSNGGRPSDFWEYDPVGNAWTQKADFAGGGRDGAVGFQIDGKGYIGTGYGAAGFLADFWEYDPTTNMWTQRADHAGGPCWSATGFSMDGKGYLATGLKEDNSLTGEVWEYDPLSDAWTRKADLPGPERWGAAAFVVGGHAYLCAGGTLSGDVDDLWKYDPATDTWEQKADFGGTARHEAVGFALGAAGYVGLGNNLYGSADLWKYDPGTDTWTQQASHGGGVREMAAVFAIGNTGFVAMGASNSVSMNDLWAYDGVLDTWSRQLPIDGGARSGAVGLSIGDKGYIGTGLDGSGYRQDFWEYDPAMDTWSQKADFGGVARYGSMSFTVDGIGYVGLGYDGDYRSDLWAYDPATNTWQQKSDHGGGPRYSAVGFSLGGSGFVVAGEDEIGNARTTCWEYDVATDTWTQRMDLPGMARTGSVAFSLGNTGYVGGGWALGSLALEDFWAYDPMGDTWTQVADFGGGGIAFAAAFSIDGRGYVGTGFDGSLRNGFWAYEPGTDTWIPRADLAGVARYDAVGFAIGDKGYIGTGDGSVWLADLWAYRTGYDCPALEANVGDPCDDGDPDTENDVWDANCECHGTPTGGPCTGHEVVVTITGGNAGDITWRFVDADNNTLASGGGAGSTTACLGTGTGAGWYGFRLEDSHGNGLDHGSWELRTMDGKLILRDAFDVASGSSPMVPGHTPSYGAYHTFALPIGPVDIHPDECEIWDNQPNNKVYAVKQGGKNYQGATLNYQFEFINPDSGRVRRTKKPRNYVLWSELTNPDLVANVKYYARVRTDKSGPLTDAHWGAGCEMSMGAPTACTGLIDDPDNQYYSCGVGVERRFRPNSQIFAWPVYGATKYKFRILNLGEGYDQEFISNNYKLELSWPANVAPKLRNGYTYQVQVSALVNGVWTAYCASCPVTINNNPSGHLVEVFGDATLWPNPARDGQVNLNIDGITSDVQHITVDVKDIYGQHVCGQEFGNTGDRFTTVLDLPGDIATGVYLANITINGEVTTKRLSIVR